MPNNKIQAIVNSDETAIFSIGENELLNKYNLATLPDGSFHLINKETNKTMLAELVNTTKDGKTVQLKVNGTVYEVQLKDKMDLLLEKMGLDDMMLTAAANIEAPMPGLVLSINVQAGDQLQKGDAVLILEAMKMENVLKADADCTIKNVAVAPGDAVEKGQLLIEVE